MAAPPFLPLHTRIFVGPQRPSESELLKLKDPSSNPLHRHGSGKHCSCSKNHPCSKIQFKLSLALKCKAWTNGWAPMEIRNWKSDNLLSGRIQLTSPQFVSFCLKNFSAFGATQRYAAIYLPPLLKIYPDEPSREKYR